MGLAVQIGVLADLLVNDPDAADWFEEELARANRALTAAGLTEHVEPRSLPELHNRTAINGYPYTFLHYLRRVAAKRLEDPTFVASPLPDDVEPDDPAVERELQLVRSHLICHSDAEGFYVPVPFEEIVFDEDPEAPGGGIIGSSPTLLRELVSVAPALRIELSAGELSDGEAERLRTEILAEEPLWIEKAVWLDLFEAARLSVQYKTAIMFG